MAESSKKATVTWSAVALAVITLLGGLVEWRASSLSQSAAKQQAGKAANAVGEVTNAGMIQIERNLMYIRVLQEEVRDLRRKLRHQLRHQERFSSTLHDLGVPPPSKLMDVAAKATGGAQPVEAEDVKIEAKKPARMPRYQKR